jgi:hypothetical protein
LATPAAILSILVQAEGVAETNRKLNQIDDSSKKASRSVDSMDKKFSHLDNTVGDFNRTFTATGNIVKLVKFPALIAGAGLAAQASGRSVLARLRSARLSPRSRGWVPLRRLG